MVEEYYIYCKVSSQYHTDEMINKIRKTAPKLLDKIAPMHFFHIQLKP